MATAAAASPAARVVLLEDHVVVGESLEALLRARGVEVVGRATTLEALRPAIERHAPHVAFVDVVLQGPGGTASPDEGIAAIADLARTAPALRSVALSGFLTPRLLVRCARAGAWGYLSKLHATGDALLDAIGRVRAGDRLFPDDLPLDECGRARVSPREREVLALVGEGADNLTIAARLGITERTVKAHVTSLYRKLGAESRLQLALLARDTGLVYAS